MTSPAASAVKQIHAAPRGNKTSPPPRTAQRSVPSGAAGNAEKRRAEYEKGVAGILQVAGAGLLFTAPADAAAVMLHTESVSRTTADLALSDERVAALLDKLMNVGPYGALIGAVAPMVVQILCNHGLVPAGILGAVPPEQLVAMVVPEMPEEKGQGTASEDGDSAQVRAN